MLGLVAGESELELAALVDVVGASADAPFGVVALSGQCLYLIGVDGHHLSHTDVAQWYTDGTEEIIGTDAVGIPFRDSPLRYTERIFLTVGECVGHGVDFHLQLAFRMHAIDGLVVDHTAIVGEEGTVLAGDIDQ